MEPFAVQSSAPGLIRPTIDLQSDLSAVLREGRVMSGEVLQTLDGETLLIGIGRHRVPARSRVRMQPGHRFLFQVQLENEAVVLRVLGDSAVHESALIKALRSVMGQSEPIGGLLERLAAALQSPGGVEATASGDLVARLDEHLFRPGGDGAELRARVANGGLGYEARVAGAVLRGLDAGAAGKLADGLRTTLLAGLVEGPSQLDAKQLGSALRGALQELFGGQVAAADAVERWARGAPVEARDGALPRDLAGVLARALIGAGLGSDAARVEQNLYRAELPSLGRDLGATLLRSLLGLPPAASVGSAAVAGELALLEGDLKGRLLRALGEAGEGPAREAIARALSGLEADQLLNLARSRSHEALHWSLPVPDGARWTTAHLFYKPVENEGGGASSPATAARRMTIAVDFTHTGPVRADLVAGPGSLAMRVLVTDADVAERMRSELSDLEGRLATGGRRVTLVIGVAPAEEIRVAAGAHDVRFLRDHHLMDTSG